MRVGYLSLFFFFFFKQKPAYEFYYGLLGSEMCIKNSITNRAELLGTTPPNWAPTTFPTKGMHEKCMYVCLCVRVCVRACVRACVCVCVWGGAREVGGITSLLYTSDAGDEEESRDRRTPQKQQKKTKR